MYIWKKVWALLCPKEGAPRLRTKRAAWPSWQAASSQRSHMHKTDRRQHSYVCTCTWTKYLEIKQLPLRNFCFPDIHYHIVGHSKKLGLYYKSTWCTISANATKKFTLSNATLAVGSWDLQLYSTWKNMDEAPDSHTKDITHWHFFSVILPKLLGLDGIWMTHMRKLHGSP